MKEGDLLRALRPYRKVRRPDYHQPATRGDNSTKRLGNGSGGSETDGGIVKRHPLSKEERTEAKKTLPLGEGGGGGGGAGQGAAAGGGTSDREGRSEGQGLIDAANFLKVFDAWIDSKYVGDRGSATKVKVAFRKQHRSMVATLCLEDIEEIAEAMR